ncbi:MAG: alpha-glucan family phosphorylase [Bacteroidales bacterium]|nr:alpha-glucan family phosphorylase [Candidatus Equibacterium intestinale]
MPGYLPEEVNVGYVTNGVHYPTWAAPEWKAIHAKVFGPEFAIPHYDKKSFEGIYKIDDSEIWSTRCLLRKRLISKVKDILSDTPATAHYSPRQIVKIKKTLRDDVLTIGFARRFATYKRATLLFRDLERLNQIVNNPDRPVQFLFAGKAHPADKAGSDLIKQIVEISKMPQFIGKIVFVPNYDITLAKYLVQGVDIWMNTPTRPQEASGTSGEKAVMNGVMHFSVLDGWWVEGYKEGAGWALPMERTYDNQEYQNDLDSATIYNIIENDIAPAYYSKEMGKEYSTNWIRIIKETIAKVACNFTTNRMMEDYLERYYCPLAERRDSLVDKDYLKARENAAWKKRMYRIWPLIEIRQFDKIDMAANKLRLGEEHLAKAEVYLADALPEDIGIECVIAAQDARGEYHICEIHEFEVVSFENGVATYRADITPEHAGSYQVATRIFAKNPCMAHRQDFELVKWL